MPLSLFKVYLLLVGTHCIIDVRVVELMKELKMKDTF